MEIRTFDKYTVLQKEHEEYLKELAVLAEKGPYRPLHHICPPCGLLNDPNGLCYYGGAYHVFYQWHPFGPSHGMKHWAHVKSENLTDWQWCDEMLVPDEEYEKNGCYSGNAFVNKKDGLCYLYYTANYKTENGRIPRQALAVMDETGHIKKYGKNPILDGAPEGISGDIRDPFVFERDGNYYMLLGAADRLGRGCLLLYSAEDLIHWQYRGTVRVPIPDMGSMVECPGFIEADGKDVLLLSVIGMKPEKDRYHNQFSSLYLTGELDLEKLEFRMEHYDEIDCGFDFYAPQVFYGKEREPLLFGWFGCGEQKLPEDAYMWRHGLTLPRKLSVLDGCLCMTLPEETENCFGSPVVIRPGTERYEPVEKSCRLELSVDKQEQFRTLTVGREGDSFELLVDMENCCVTWDRSGLAKKADPEYGMIRRVHLHSCEKMKLELFLDNSFVEIYINDGERVLSGRAYL